MKKDNKRVEDIKNLYLTILEREADHDGLKHYVNSKLSIQKIKETLLSSDERKRILHIKHIQTISIKDFVNEPVVSIIIPVFKNVFWLIEAVNSLLNQTYKQFEIIIVNDGSKENVDDIVKLYSRFPNIKYHKHVVNKGVSAARNTGILYATGRYILPFDSDDVASDINWLNDCIKIIDKNTIVTTPYNLCDRNNSLNEIWPPREFEFSEATNRGGIIVNSSMYPKALWTKNNGYDENLYLYEDADFWLGAYFKGYKLKHLKKPYVNYRIHGTSLSDSNITIKESAWNYIRKKHNLSTTWEQLLAND